MPNSALLLGGISCADTKGVDWRRRAVVWGYYSQNTYLCKNPKLPIYRYHLRVNLPQSRSRYFNENPVFGKIASPARNAVIHAAEGIWETFRGSIELYNSSKWRKKFLQQLGGTLKIGIFRKSAHFFQNRDFGKSVDWRRRGIFGMFSWVNRAL